MGKAKNTHIEFELADGSTVKLTLTYWLLAKLKGCRKDAYARYNEVMVKGAKEELDNIVVLYAAYLCGVIEEDGDAKGAMSEEDFMRAVPYDPQAMNDAIMGLIGPKGRRASGTSSKAGPESRGGAA